MCIKKCFIYISVLFCSICLYCCKNSYFINNDKKSTLGNSECIFTTKNNNIYKCGNIYNTNCYEIRKKIKYNKIQLVERNNDNMVYDIEIIKQIIINLLNILDEKCFCWTYYNNEFCFEYDEENQLILVAGQYLDRGIYYIGEPAEIVYDLQEKKVIYELYPNNFLYKNAYYINGNIASYKEMGRKTKIDKYYIINNYKNIIFQNLLDLYGEPNGFIKLNECMYPYYTNDEEIIIIKNDLSTLHNYRDLINSIDVIKCEEIINEK